MKIESGLFAGIEVPESEITFLRNDGGEPTPWWAPMFRTPHFIQKFSPLDGWAVIVNAKAGEFNLPDYSNATPGAQPPIQPTQLFEARLVKEGIVFATASSLEIIDGEKAWERGETNCRGRLYEALGLPGAVKGANAGVTSPTQVKGHKTAKTAAPVVVPMAGTPTPATQPQHVVTTQATEPDSSPEPVVEAAPVVEQVIPEPVASIAVDNSTAPPATVQHAPGINANLLSQIERQARLVGLPMRSLASNEDAKKFFAELLKQSSTKVAS